MYVRGWPRSGMKKESVRDIPSEEGISPGMMDAGICVSIGTTEARDFLPYLSGSVSLEALMLMPCRVKQHDTRANLGYSAWLSPW